jgi:arylformamidase
MTQAPYDPVWLERMYNNRALVPDHMVYFDRWTQASKQARASQPCSLDVRYGDGEGELLDVFPASSARAGGSPVMVFIHGGYWRSLDKSGHSFMAPAFTQSGVCVVVVNYALCPGTAQAPVTIPDIVRQMEKALVWVGRNIAHHGGNPEHITAVGHSAGGLLAALLLTSVWPLIAADLPDGLVRSALSISGVHDLEPLMYTPYLQESLHLTEQQVLHCSPARLLEPPAGVLHCAVGGDESPEFLRQNRLMHEAWGSHTVPRCQVLEGLNHFSILDTLAQPGKDLHHMALNLLRA